MNTGLFHTLYEKGNNLVLSNFQKHWQQSVLDEGVHTLSPLTMIFFTHQNLIYWWAGTTQIVIIREVAWNAKWLYEKMMYMYLNSLVTNKINCSWKKYNRNVAYFILLGPILNSLFSGILQVRWDVILLTKELKFTHKPHHGHFYGLNKGYLHKLSQYKMLCNSKVYEEAT